jgi:protein gp37/ParB-like chromosome segregation protein Spo0J
MQHTITKLNVETLKSHELNETIYGEEPVDTSLMAAMQQDGLLEPLLVTEDFRILSGHRRWKVAKELGWSQIDAKVMPLADEAHELSILLSANVQRKKTNWQLCQEAKYLKKAADQRAASRKAKAGKGETIPEVQKGQSRDEVGKALSISGRQADHLLRLAEFFDHCEGAGDQETLEEVKTLLDNSVRSARNHTAVKDYVRRMKQQKGTKAAADSVSSSMETRKYVTLEDWEDLTNEERAGVLKTIGSTSMNLAGASIEWAAWSWNPVTGCLHNCPYCYARDTAERYYDQGFAPSLIPSALSKPTNTKPPTDGGVRERNVFTCSMADLFGRWVPHEWIDAVFDVMRGNPEWNFLTLTKFPQRLYELNVPANCWMGATLDVQSRLEMTIRSFEKLKKTNPGITTWLSLEPLLEPLQFESLAMFDWIVIGGASRSSQTPAFAPPSSWYEAIIEVARRDGCNVFVKQNLLYRPQELPGEAIAEVERAPDAFFVGRNTEDEAPEFELPVI